MKNDDLISRSALLAEYDRVHVGPPGGARKLMEEAPAVLPEPRREEREAFGMTSEQFTALVEEIREKSLDTLLTKNANYGNEDRLHNFRSGAAIIGGTPAQAALGYMAKHMASLIDKVQTNNFHDRDDFLEKVQDCINYLVFIWCCGNEEREKYTRAEIEAEAQHDESRAF